MVMFILYYLYSNISLRKYDIPQEPYMEFDCEAKAGYKHHLSAAYLAQIGRASLGKECA